MRVRSVNWQSIMPCREDGIYHQNSSSLGYDSDDEMHSTDLGNISMSNSEGSRFVEFRTLLVSSPLDPQFVPIPEGELEARINAIQKNLFVREPTPPIEALLQVLTLPGLQNMDVSQDIVLNPNEQFDANDIVEADSGDSVEGPECYSRVISENDNRSSVMGINSTPEPGFEDVNVSQDRVLNQQFGVSEIIQADSGDSVEELECYLRVISESDDHSSVMDMDDASEPGSQDVDVSLDRVLNPNDQFHMSDIIQADSDDSVEVLECYLRIISESDDHSSVMDIDDASVVSSMTEEESSFETNISTPDGHFLITIEGLNQTISYPKHRVMLVRLIHCLIQYRMTRSVDVIRAPRLVIYQPQKD
ncbi:hypothetical protein QAD02_007747 [Eretmocerus hayati]|uniref:Uncharacterized protein n=1 Tax=Eretmocerus hayati TaxID=131215 RepID=A0ACC2N4J5_9HYME|nr:hypothetical protein QAD02_007747 [Eretmocerus hayati]